MSEIEKPVVSYHEFCEKPQYYLVWKYDPYTADKTMKSSAKRQKSRAVLWQSNGRAMAMDIGM